MATRSRSTTTPARPSLLSRKLSTVAAASSRSARAVGRPAAPAAAEGPQDWNPEPYQLEAAKFLVSRGCASLFLKPGLRKTSIVLAALKVLLRKKLVRRVLVVAPPRVCRSVWPSEVEKWRDFSGLRVCNLSDDRVSAARRDDLLDSDVEIFCISFNSLEWMFGVTKTRGRTGKVRVDLDYSRMERCGVDCLVVDEVSKARNWTGIHHKILAEARERFGRVYTMTGSPKPKNLMNLFGVMRLTDGGYSLGAYITHYRNAFFYPSGYGGYDYQPKDGAAEQIEAKMAPFVFSVKANDLIHIPKIVVDLVNVDLPESARKVYDQVEKDFLAELDHAGGRVTVTALNSGVSSGKCSQIANGGLYLAQEVDEEGRKVKGKREWVALHDEKTEAVADLLEELDGDPALVFYDYGHDLERLLARLGKDTPRIGGGVKSSESDRLISEWNAGKLPCLLCHPGSMSHGLNMQGGGATHAIWHSLIWDYEAFDQSMKRLARSGNPADRVFAHLLVAKNTTDEAKARTMRDRERGQDALLESMAEYTLRRHRKLGAAIKKGRA